MTKTATVPGASPDGDLATRWQALREAERGLRIRDAADRLGVAEAALLATRCGAGVTRLDGSWGDLVARLPELGTVMVLTRNSYAVHEKVGRFGNVSVMGAMGLVLNREVDLRLFLGRWSSGFAVSEAAPGGERRSLQFFDAAGTAVHKVYLRDDSDGAAYDRLVATFAAADRAAEPCVAPELAPARGKPDADIDRALLRERWQALRDVHDFRAMLEAVGVGRLQALRLVGADLASPVDANAFRRALEAAAAVSLPIMVFVASPGAVQIHTGAVTTLTTVGPWFNVLDPGFNLHLREDGVATAWVVRKPTRDGVVTSLEIYDAAGGQIAQMFGERHEGEAERTDWRALLDTLPATREA